MKNKLKYILLVVGVVLIIFGALIPTIFKSEKKEYDKLAFTHDMGIGLDYSCNITVTSTKDYNINTAIVYFEDFFEEQELVKEVDSSKISKSVVGENYVYTFTVKFSTFGEYSDFSKIKQVKLNTNLGTRIAVVNSEQESVNWKVPVMIVVIFAGVAISLFGVSLIIAPKFKKKSVEMIEQVKEQINIQENLKEEASQSKDNICEYCGSTNSYDAKKCSSCGASLKQKK